MANQTYSIRLQREYKQIMKEPIPNIIARPSSNILEWHYVITGPAQTPYENGEYHGVLKFTTEYPMKPPGIIMFTPNGRFATNTRLCLSMSDYHPESWNPMWSVGSILTGLLSFMLENTSTTGSTTSTTDEKRKYAQFSRIFNRRNRQFVKIFPELAEIPAEEPNTGIQETAQKSGTLTESKEDLSKSFRDYLLLLIGILVAAAAIVRYMK